MASDQSGRSSENRTGLMKTHASRGRTLTLNEQSSSLSRELTLYKRYFETSHLTTIERPKMRSGVSTSSTSAFLELSGPLVRCRNSALYRCSLQCGHDWAKRTGSLAAFSLEVTASSPAQARCLIAGAMRNDIPDNDCLEAQRTGCVRHLLTEQQYVNCLAANKRAMEQRQICVIGGVIRNDLSPLDCKEAKATGCVRRLLTDAQYVACLNAQRH